MNCSMFNHSQIISVHGYSCTVLSLEIRAIAGMVMISMSYLDELEISRLAARTFKFFPKVGALGWKPGINQDITCVGFYQVAIYATEIDGFDLRSHLILLLLDFNCRREFKLKAHRRTGPIWFAFQSSLLEQQRTDAIGPGANGVPISVIALRPNAKGDTQSKL